MAINAMFLPGISGAFILLIMGLYEPIIDMVHRPFSNIVPLLIFAVGAGLGAFTISRIISFLFARCRCQTLYILLGLVIGCLSIPVKKIVYSGQELNFARMAGIFGLFLSGLLVVVAVRRLEAQNKEEL